MDAEHFEVVVVAAHPDDAEIGMGGTMAKLADAGVSVLLVNLTDGEPTPLGTHEIRMQEAERAASILGIRRLTMDLPNRRLFDTFEGRVALADVLRRHTPRLVMCMKGKTVMASPDHHQAQLLTEAAVFYSRLSKWPEHFRYPVHTVQKLVYFPVRLRHEEAQGPEFAVDISATLDRKMAAIEAYESQFPPEKRSFLRRVRLHNESNGAQMGVHAAEIFEMPRLPILEATDMLRI